MSNILRYMLPAAAVVGILYWQFGFGLFVTIAAFIGVLYFLVIAHELGHFTVAKLLGVKVLEFGIGMPPRVWGKQKGETEYTINLLPIGGFVRMLGEEDPTHPESFARQAPWKRLAVLGAGPGVNALLPIVLLFVALMIPRTVTVTDVTILQVVDNSPAAEAGVERGDIIRRVDSEDIANTAELAAAIQQRLGADTTWVVERDGELVTLRIPEVRVDPPEGQGATGIAMVDVHLTVSQVDPNSPASAAGLQAGDRIVRIGEHRVLSHEDVNTVVSSLQSEDPGSAVPISVYRDGEIVELSLDPSLGQIVSFSTTEMPDETRSLNPIAAVPASFEQLWEILVVFRNEISRIVGGGGGVELAGPVGIAQLTGEVARAGVGQLVTWAALLSINLAIINALPIPALDGGRMTFVLLELARGGRRIAPEKERIVHLVGFALLMAAIFLVTANDLRRLVGGSTFFG